MNINLTLLGQMISFGFFVWFCVRFIWPPIIKVLHDRQEKIVQSLNDAEKAKNMLEEAQKEAENILKVSKKEANEIIASTQKISQSILEEAKKNANQEFDRIIDSTNQQIDQIRNQVKKELQNQLGSLVLLGVSRVLDEKEIDQEVHQNIVHELQKKLQ